MPGRFVQLAAVPHEVLVAPVQSDEVLMDKLITSSGRLSTVLALLVLALCARNVSVAGTSSRDFDVLARRILQPGGGMLGLSDAEAGAVTVDFTNRAVLGLPEGVDVVQVVLLRVVLKVDPAVVQADRLVLPRPGVPVALEHREEDAPRFLAGEVGIVHPGQAKVQDLDLAGGCQHDVLRLQIPVYEAEAIAVVAGGGPRLEQRIGNFDADFDGRLRVHLLACRGAVLHDLPQRDAVNVLHHNGAFVLQKFIHANDGAVFHLLEQRELLPQKPERLRVRRLPHALDRDQPSSRRLSASRRRFPHGEAHRAELALPEFADDFVASLLHRFDPTTIATPYARRPGRLTRPNSHRRTLKKAAGA